MFIHLSSSLFRRISIGISITLFAFAHAPHRIMIYSAGGAAMADYSLADHSPFRGWMQMLPMFFDLNTQVHNYGTEAGTMEAFKRTGKWENILEQLKAGDYVFLQFSVDDADSSLKILPELTQMIVEVRSKKANPILFSPIPEGNFDNSGKLINHSPGFSTRLEKLAAEMQAPLIHLGERTGEMLQQLGPEKAKDIYTYLPAGADGAFPRGLADDHHLSVYGAEKVAALAADEIKKQIPGLAPAFKNEFIENTKTSPLPAIFDRDEPDLIANDLKMKGALESKLRILPSNKTEWEEYRRHLIKMILQKSGAVINHTLPLDLKETGSTQLSGYSVKNIEFQTRPGLYATANLYVPDGKGPFPAVVNMHGHWPNGRMGDIVQSVGHTLALNGYVCLNIDAWGSGERTTIHGVQEYHGANLGASLMNLGETLLGDQLSDNIRAVDLLSSLSYVDKEKIGATGASGGGNQTMWLAAIDSRIKAAMPVVSVGTFDAYIMGSNCVCELLPDGLTFMEEAGTLGLVAPRALKLCNALLDASTSFYPSEMLKSYERTLPIFLLYSQRNKLSYQLFNTGHGYWPEMRETLLGFMDQQLKGIGDGSPEKEKAFTVLPPEKLMVFPVGKRDELVQSIAAYCHKAGIGLTKELLSRTSINTVQKEKDLSAILRLEPDDIKNVHIYSPEHKWQRLALETLNHHTIPLIFYAPAGKNAPYVLLCSPEGKGSISPDLINEYIQKGYGIILADLWGIGRNASATARITDGSLPPFHTLSRSELWLGKTVMGEWVSDLRILASFIKTRYQPAFLTIDAYRENGLAALFETVLDGRADSLILRNSLVSYAFDERAGIDFFSMAIHVPGILPWGDVSLAAALSGKNILFLDPVSMSGRPLDDRSLAEYKSVFIKMRSVCKTSGKTTFKRSVLSTDHSTIHKTVHHE